MDTNLILGTISGLKTASEIAKGMAGLKSLSDVQGKVIELQTAILSAQDSAIDAKISLIEMSEKISELENQIAGNEEWELEKLRYKLHSPWQDKKSGAIVYALKESMSNGEIPHWICTSCYENGKKSILNVANKLIGSNAIYVCPVCNSSIYSPYTITTQPDFPPE